MAPVEIPKYCNGDHTWLCKAHGHTKLHVCTVQCRPNSSILGAVFSIQLAQGTDPRDITWEIVAINKYLLLTPWKNNFVK